MKQMNSDILRANTYKVFSDMFKYPDESLVQNRDIFKKTLFWIDKDVSNQLVSLMKVDGSFFEELLVEYSKLFVGPNHIEAAPYSSVYLDNQALVFGKSTQEAINFYIESGLDPSKENKEPPDHIATELEFMYFLIFNGIINSDKNKIKQSKEFFRKHLGAWAGQFADKIINNSENKYYKNLAKLFSIFIKKEKEHYHQLVE